MPILVKKREVRVINSNLKTQTLEFQGLAKCLKEERLREELSLLFRLTEKCSAMLKHRTPTNTSHCLLVQTLLNFGVQKFSFATFRSITI